MKVQNNSIYMGEDLRSVVRHDEGRANNKKSHTIDGRALQAKVDPIAAKKEEAKKKAMKIVGDAFANDLKIDDGLKVRRDRIKTLKDEMKDASRSIKELEADRATLRDAYGVEANSQEEQDLKLLEKEIRYKMPGNDVHYDEGDLEKIAQIKENGLTEYQKRSLEKLELEVPYANTVYENKQEIAMENQIISATRIERLKSNPMMDAQKQASAIMEAATEEIAGMLVDEAKEHMDDEIEERKEAAKEKAEEKEEVEARIEKAKDEKKEKEKITEEIIEGAADVSSNTRNMEAAQEEIKDMMNKMKLIEDDIKGATVDKSL